jgi:hypothetical protein
MTPLAAVLSLWGGEDGISTLCRKGWKHQVADGQEEEDSSKWNMAGVTREQSRCQDEVSSGTKMRPDCDHAAADDAGDEETRVQ